MWYTPQSEAAEKLLGDSGLEFDYHLDCYKIALKNSKQAAELIKKHDEISDFEFVKGNMDDVFLTVTGKRLGD